MAKYPGVSKRVLQDGTVNIYVRFKHQGTAYREKNFTKKFGCRTEKSAFEQLQKVKVWLSEGKDVFGRNNSLVLNDLWDEKLTTVDWRETTRSHYTNFYDVVIRNTLGKKAINKITVQDILDLKEKHKHKSISYRNRIKNLISPIIDDCVLKGKMEHNPLSILKNQSAKAVKPLSQRVTENELTIARKLYKMLIKNDFEFVGKKYHKRIVNNEETNSFFLLMLMSAHRFGELLQLRKSDIYCKKNKIVTPIEITKTKEVYEYPLPEELKEYVNKIEDDELLFPYLDRSSVSARFNKLINNIGIELIKDQRITPHDIRRIFTSILVKEKVDVTLVDYSLDHKIKGVISHYLHYTYEDKIKVYDQYWELIRN